MTSLVVISFLSSSQAALGLEVDRDALLVGVERAEDRALLPPLVLGHRNPGDHAGAVRPGGGFHVDHLRAEHRQDVRGGRPGPEGGQVEHPQAGVRQLGPGRGPAVQGPRCGPPRRRCPARCRCARRSAGPAAPGAARQGSSRYGPAGCRNSSRGLRRNTPRSRKCSSSVTVAPLLTGALGMRKAVARSLMSATVRSAIHSRSCGAYRLGELADADRRGGVDPLRVAHHGAQVEPLLCGAAPEGHKPVLGGGDAGLEQRALGPPGPVQRLEEGHRVVGQAQHRDFEHRQVDELPRAGLRARGRARPGCRWPRTRRTATPPPGRRRAPAPGRALPGPGRRSRRTRPGG